MHPPLAPFPRAAGRCFYSPPAFNMSAGRVGYFVIDLPGGSYWMDTLRNTTAPAPGGADLDWAVWPVAKMRGEPLCDYLVRFNTTGGELRLEWGVRGGVVVPGWGRARSSRAEQGRERGGTQRVQAAPLRRCLAA